MGVDAGSVYSSIRIRLTDLDNDLKGVYARLGQLEANITKTTVPAQKNFKDMFAAVFTGQAALELAKKGLDLLVSGIKDSIRVATESQEMISKYDVVFGGMGDQSEEAANRFSKAFDLAGATSKEMLSNTGNLLQGMGATKEESLDLSLKVNTLASDLASFTNNQGGASAASEALTKALLGEKESMKTLGIAILDSDVNARLAQKGQDGLTGTALKLAKAQATLELITEQSKNAIGDYARTADSAANVQKRSAESTKELQITIGTGLNGAVKAANLLWIGFSEGLSKVIKRSEGVGELKGATDDLISSSKLYKDITDQLATSSDTLTGKERDLLANRQQLARLDMEKALAELSKGYKDSAEQIGKLSSKEKSREADLASYTALMRTLNNVTSQNPTIAAEAAKAAGVTIEQGRLAYAAAAKGMEDANRSQITSSQKLSDAELKHKESIYAIARAINSGAGPSIEIYKNTNKALYDEIIAATIAVKEEDEATKKKSETDKKAASDAQARIDADQKYIEQRKIVTGVLEDNKTEYQKIQDQIDSINLKWAAGSINEKDRQKALDILIGKQKELNKTKDELLEKVNNLGKAEESESEKAKDALIEQVKALKLAPEQEQLAIDKINEYYATLEKKESFNQFAKNASIILSTATSMYSAYADLINQLNKNEVEEQERALDKETKALTEALDERQKLESDYLEAQQDAQDEALKSKYDGVSSELDAELQQKLYTAGLTTASTVEQYQAELDAAIATGDATAIDEAQKALEKATLEKEYADKQTALKAQQAADQLALDTKQADDKAALEKKQAAEKTALDEAQAKKKAQIEYKAALTSWQMQLTLAIASAAQAVLAAFQSGMAYPFIGPATGAAFAAAAAVTGAIQVSAVKAAKPVLAYATGGIVPGSSMVGDLVQANVNSGEMVLTTAQQAKLFALINGGGSNNSTTSPTVFQIGTVIGSASGLRELNRLLAKYGSIEQKRTGK